jgi:hypothetical protein
MRSDYTYEVHRIVEDAQFRHRSRDLEHRRAIREAAPKDGFLSRMASGVRRLRAATPPAISIEEALELTDRVCQLADGANGRIAVRKSGAELIEVCIPV